MQHKKKTSKVLFGITGMCASALGTQAFEASDLLSYSMGPLVLRPSFGVEETFDSNLFYQSQNLESDFITYLAPGLSATLGRKDHNFISLDYGFRAGFYANRNDLNTQNHSFKILDHVEFSKLKIDGIDEIDFLEEVLGGGLRSLNEIAQTELVKRVTYLNRYTATYSISDKTSVYLTGTHDATDYDKGTTLLDYNTLTGTAGFGYKIFSKTDMFSEIYYGQQATNPNRPFDPADLSTQKGPHSEFIGGFIGMRGDFTAKLSGSAKIGYETRNFSDGSPAPDGPVGEVSLKYAPTAKSTITLGYLRHTSVSIQAGSTAYTDDSITARYDQYLGTRGKLSAFLALAYDIYNYEGNSFANREDNLYTISTGLNYQIQLWLRAKLQYDFQKFDTNLQGLTDYDVHRVTLSMVVGY